MPAMAPATDAGDDFDETFKQPMSGLSAIVGMHILFRMVRYLCVCLMQYAVALSAPLERLCYSTHSPYGSQPAHTSGTSAQLLDGDEHADAVFSTRTSGRT